MGFWPKLNMLDTVCNTGNVRLKKITLYCARLLCLPILIFFSTIFSPQMQCESGNALPLLGWDLSNIHTGVCNYPE